MFRKSATHDNTARRAASAVALFAAAGILAATVAPTPASATSEFVRYYWADQSVERQDRNVVFARSAARHAPEIGSQFRRYWSGELSDRRELLQNLALAESIRVHGGEAGAVLPRVAALDARSGPDFWGGANARR